MTKQTIVQRLIETKSITAEEAVILLQETKETVTVPYHINNEDNKGIWYSTIS
jgi:hypothetical protein